MPQTGTGRCRSQKTMLQNRIHDYPQAVLLPPDGSRTKKYIGKAKAEGLEIPCGSSLDFPFMDHWLKSMGRKNWSVPTCSKGPTIDFEDYRGRSVRQRGLRETFARPNPIEIARNPAPNCHRVCGQPKIEFRKHFRLLLSFGSACSGQRRESGYGKSRSSGNGTELCHNLITLSPDAPAFWDHFCFAVKLRQPSADGKTMETEFDWLPHPNTNREPYMSLLDRPEIPAQPIRKGQRVKLYDNTEN